MSERKSLLGGGELTICLVLAIIIGLSGTTHNPGAGMNWRVGYVVGTFLGILLIYLAIKGLWRMMVHIVRRINGTDPNVSKTIK